jgi:nitrite reductase/ring-hydroxylating ferredoxin subunit
MESWIELCAAADIPDKGAIEAQLLEDSVVLIRYGARVFGYLNICPHAGRPLNWAPNKFLLMSGQLVCAAHGATFKPESGECIGGPCRGQSLRSINIKDENGTIFGWFPSPDQAEK